MPKIAYYKAGISGNFNVKRFKNRNIVMFGIVIFLFLKLCDYF